MQKFHYQLDHEDHRIVRRWRLASVEFYGSILLGLILYVTLTAHHEVDYASAKPLAPASAVGGMQE